jgi:hypothetical protein
MFHLALVAGLLQTVSAPLPPISGEIEPLCVETRKLAAGVPAPCTGLLWSPAQSREALKCAEVRVPMLEADLKRVSDLSQVQQLQAQRNIEFRDKIIDQLMRTPKPAPDADSIELELLTAFSLGLASGALIVVLVQ